MRFSQTRISVPSTTSTALISYSTELLHQMPQTPRVDIPVEAVQAAFRVVFSHSVLVDPEVQRHLDSLRTVGRRLAVASPLMIR